MNTRKSRSENLPVRNFPAVRGMMIPQKRVKFFPQKFAYRNFIRDHRDLRVSCMLRDILLTNVRKLK